MHFKGSVTNSSSCEKGGRIQSIGRLSVAFTLKSNLQNVAISIYLDDQYTTLEKCINIFTDISAVLYWCEPSEPAARSTKRVCVCARCEQARRPSRGQKTHAFGLYISSKSRLAIDKITRKKDATQVALIHYRV